MSATHTSITAMPNASTTARDGHGAATAMRGPPTPRPIQIAPTQSHPLKNIPMPHAVIARSACTKNQRETKAWGAVPEGYTPIKVRKTPAKNAKAPPTASTLFVASWIRVRA
ncbi:hypothetical protein AC480_02685 [miscellaneous Crenarchaeota group archaeon SMTZ1-55]|nr:MAG: hypothetical protein AC480_02685 [miscellaneous Crenarchaeota group archaeon SMTZ1-55]